MCYSTKSFFRALTMVVALVVGSIYPPLSNGATIVDNQGVIYDILTNSTDSKTVQISALNSSKFASQAVDLVIPVTVTDVSTVNTQSGEFTVTKMAEGAFKNTTITSINIEAPITAIPNNAFNGASKLTTVRFTSDVTSLGQYAFYGCSSLTSVADEGMQNVTSIGQYAFCNCSSLPTLKLAEGITTINQSVFSGCSQLNDIVLPSTITTINQTAFSSCTSLQCPVFPNGLKTIGVGAFSGCTSLGDVTFPAGVSLQQSAFASSYITSITWPEEAMTIDGEYCFRWVSGLTELTLPDYITTIPKATFYNITSLTKLTLPDRMDSIGWCAFEECSDCA